MFVKKGNRQFLGNIYSGREVRMHILAMDELERITGGCAIILGNAIRFIKVILKCFQIL